MGVWKSPAAEGRKSAPRTGRAPSSDRRGDNPGGYRLSRDTTDLLVIAREMQRAEAGAPRKPLAASTGDDYRCRTWRFMLGTY